MVNFENVNEEEYFGRFPVVKYAEHYKRGEKFYAAESVMQSRDPEQKADRLQENGGSKHGGSNPTTALPSNTAGFKPVHPESSVASLLTFAAILLSISAIILLIAVVMWCSYRKRKTEYNEYKQLKQAERRRSSPRSTKAHSRSLSEGTLAQLAGNNPDLDASHYKEEHLSDITVSNVELSGIFYRFRDTLVMNTKKVTVDSISDIISQNTYIYIVIKIVSTDESTSAPLSKSYNNAHTPRDTSHANAPSGRWFESKLKTIARYNEFTETCEFQIPLDQLDECRLQLVVYACDRFSRFRKLSTKDYTITKSENEKKDLIDISPRTDQSKDRPTDEIQMTTKTSIKELNSSNDSIMYIKDEEILNTSRESLNNDISKVMSSIIQLEFTQIDSNANSPVRSPEPVVRECQLMFSLCYMPTSGRLTVVVLNGKNLQKGGKIPIITYIRVSLMVDGTTQQSFQTSHVKKTANPVYNEPFMFHMSEERIKETDISFTVMIQDQPAVSANYLGRVVVGNSAKSSEGKRHWEAMLVLARKPVAQVHVF